MANIIDLNEHRHERPDPECIRKDEYGREMYLFVLSYEYLGAKWSIEIWAYSKEDAQDRVKAIISSLEYSGMVYSIIPF